MRRTNIVQRIQHAIQNLNGMHVWLYGSEARGDARADSDVDLLILLDKDNITFADKLRINDVFTDVMMETGIAINPYMDTVAHWGTQHSPFYESVMKDKVAI